MKSQIEKSRRRRKLYGKKKYIIAAFVIFLGVPAVVMSYALIADGTRPLFVSPLPFLKEIAFSSTANNEAVKDKIAADLAKKHLLYTRIDTVAENSYSIQLSDGSIIIITKNKDISSQITSLQVIYNRLTMEGKRFKKLDLRFSKPVITF